MTTSTRCPGSYALTRSDLIRCQTCGDVNGDAGIGERCEAFVDEPEAEAPVRLYFEPQAAPEDAAAYCAHPCRHPDCRLARELRAARRALVESAKASARDGAELERLRAELAQAREAQAGAVEAVVAATYGATEADWAKLEEAGLRWLARFAPDELDEDDRARLEAIAP